MRRKNRAPGTSWMLRRPISSYPNGYVLTLEDDLIQVVYFEHANYPQTMILSRRDARLMARRINECLDGSR